MERVWISEYYAALAGELHFLYFLGIPADYREVFVVGSGILIKKSDALPPELTTRGFIIRKKSVKSILILLLIIK
jgi:hypothetical protein